MEYGLVRFKTQTYITQGAAAGTRAHASHAGINQPIGGETLS